METQLLNDPDTYPSEAILKKKCASYFPALMTLLDKITQAPFDLTLEWRFYKDGKAWLCKISYKKKTVAWLSTWPEHFKVSFYFTEKTGVGIPDLEIHEILKEAFKISSPIGKLRPLVVEAGRTDNLRDVYTLMEYKRQKL